MKKYILFLLIFIPVIASAKEETLYDTIVNLSSKENISNFYVANDSKIYEYKVGDDTIYFYNGNKVDNNAILNDTCFKIVRTTDTKGVKLLYAGKAKDGKCNNTGEELTIGKSAFSSISYKVGDSYYGYFDNDDHAGAGYMTGKKEASSYDATHTNENDSLLKKKIDEWYKNEFLSNKDYLEDTVFCNDRSYYFSDATGDYKPIYQYYSNTNTNYNSWTSTYSFDYSQNHNYGGFLRFNYKKENPTLFCALNNDKYTTTSELGNGKLTYPVATITYDEYILGGNTYGYFDGSEFWTLTPSYMDFEFYGEFKRRKNNLYIYYTSATVPSVNKASTEKYVRPVVSIKNEVVVKRGDGTKDNPYILGWPEEESLTTKITTKKIIEIKEDVPTGIKDYIVLLILVIILAIMILRYNKKKDIFK